LIEEEFLTEDAGNMRKSFVDIGSRAEYWQWVRGPLLSAYYDSGYSIDNLPTTGQSATSDAAGGYLLNENLILGSLRLQQVRVNPTGCSHIGDELNQTCFPSWHSGDPSEAAFGPSLQYTHENGGVGYWPKQVYTSIAVYMLEFYRSMFTDGGFYVDFSQNNASTYTTDLATHVSNNWLDSQTRAVLAHLILYNANLNLFVLGSMTVEFSESGMAYPQSQFQSFSATTFRDFPWTYCLMLPMLLTLYVFKLARSTFERNLTKK